MKQQSLRYPSNRPSVNGSYLSTVLAWKDVLASSRARVCLNLMLRPKTLLWGVLPSAKRPEGRAARGRPGGRQVLLQQPCLAWVPIGSEKTEKGAARQPSKPCPVPPGSSFLQ